jgi:hypothetical protein
MTYEDLANVAELAARKPEIKTGTEYDAVHAPQYLYWQAHERKSVKRGMNRRTRRGVRQLLASAY